MLSASLNKTFTSFLTEIFDANITVDKNVFSILLIIIQIEFFSILVEKPFVYTVLFKSCYSFLNFRLLNIYYSLHSLL